MTTSAWSAPAVTSLATQEAIRPRGLRTQHVFGPPPSRQRPCFSRIGFWRRSTDSSAWTDTAATTSPSLWVTNAPAPHCVTPTPDTARTGLHRRVVTELSSHRLVGACSATPFATVTVLIPGRQPDIVLLQRRGPRSPTSTDGVAHEGLLTGAPTWRITRLDAGRRHRQRTDHSATGSHDDLPPRPD